MMAALMSAWSLRGILLPGLLCVGLAGSLALARHEQAIAIYAQQQADQARQAAAQEHADAQAAVDAMRREMVRGQAQAARDGRRRQAVTGAGNGADRVLHADTLHALRVR